MMLRGFSFFRFCSRITKNQPNSINPVTEHVAYGHYFPKQWDQNEIFSKIDPSRKKLKFVQLIRNKIGQPSGKVLLKFDSAQSLKAYIQRYNQDFIITKESAHRVIIKPFELRTREKGLDFKEKKTKHQVKVKNLDFDITAQELERLAKDFGKVAHVQIHVRPSGLNNGVASVYFQKRAEAEDFTYFCQGLLYKERKLTAEVVEQSTKDNQIKSLEVPKVTLQSHEYIYRKLVAKNFQINHQSQKISMESRPKQ